MTLSLSTGKALAFGPEGLRGTLLPQPDCCCWQAEKSSVLSLPPVSFHLHAVSLDADG